MPHSTLHLRRLAVATLVVSSLGFPAHALDKIYSPNVEYREISVEYSGSRTFDHDSSKDNAQSHEFSVEAGITPRLMVEAGMGYVKNPDESLKLDGLELEGRYQFFEQGENWVDTGVLLAYGFASQKDDPDGIEANFCCKKTLV